jgi:hypothetical protein
VRPFSSSGILQKKEPELAFRPSKFLFVKDIHERITLLEKKEKNE